MADIFVSYAREDRDRARLLAETLSAQGGWSIFWDRHIPHGHDFVEYLQAQLDQARCVIVLWSKNSVGSQFVRDEAAEGQNGRLVPVLIEAVRPPLGFRQLQRADLTDWTGQPSHEEFDRLVTSIQAIVPSNLSTAPSPGGSVGAAEARVSPGQETPLDVYVSFAEQDNRELVQGQRGWVDNLQRALGIRLNQLRGVESEIWRSARTSEAVSEVEKREALEEALDRASVFVAVVSPRYVESIDARRELRTFLRHGRPQPSGKGKSRVFKVMKTPVPAERQPSELRSVLGYQFYKIDEAGRVREFDQIFGPEAERDFWISLDELAHEIASLDER
jgi:hypothetical protein